MRLLIAAFVVLYLVPLALHRFTHITSLKGPIAQLQTTHTLVHSFKALPQGNTPSHLHSFNSLELDFIGLNARLQTTHTPWQIPTTPSHKTCQVIRKHTHTH
jgi:hypothetical protein